MEFLVLSFELNDDDWFSVWSFLNFKGPMFHICLDDRIVVFSADKSLGVEDSVVWVFGSLVFGSISNQSFSLGEGDIRWSGPISLVVGNDFDSVILPDSDT